MLALKDKYHRVEASVPGLADFAKVAPERVLEALEVLKSPDPWSRTKEHEGRRIREVDGGWEILNGGKYQEKLDELDRLEKNRKNQAAFRDRQRALEIEKAKQGEGKPKRPRGRPRKLLPAPGASLYQAAAARGDGSEEAVLKAMERDDEERFGHLGDDGGLI